MATAKKAKKRRPQDLTLRNLRAMRRDISKLYVYIKDLNRCMAINVESLNTRLISLEQKREKR